MSRKVELTDKRWTQQQRLHTRHGVQPKPVNATYRRGAGQEATPPARTPALRGGRRS